MTMRNLKLAAAGVLLSASVGAQATLLKSYDFIDGLNDSLASGVDLVAFGGTVSDGRYTFGANQGLRLVDALADTAEYGIEIRFQANDDLTGYSKLIDLANRTSDIGLYMNGDSIDFYNAGPSGGTLVLDTDYTVAIERAAGNITVFLDGVLLFSADDRDEGLAIGNVLNFFIDDTHTGGTESFAGSAEFVRIHQDRSSFGVAPIVKASEPGLLAFAFLGVVGVVARRRS